MSSIERWYGKNIHNCKDDERKAVRFQNACQSHTSGKILPMVIKSAQGFIPFSVTEKMSLNCFR